MMRLQGFFNLGICVLLLTIGFSRTTFSHWGLTEAKIVSKNGNVEKSLVSTFKKSNFKKSPMTISEKENFEKTSASNIYMEKPSTKPFKRVLVISGGGFNPGVSIGIISGLLSKGWRPDLIITSCGAGIGSVIYNSEKDIINSFDLLRSPAFFRSMSDLRVETPSVIDTWEKLNAGRNIYRYPDIFSGNLMNLPNELLPAVRNDRFNEDPKQTKFIILTAKSLFQPNQVGSLRSRAPLFKEVFFTDPETAKLLKGRKNSAEHSFPHSTIAQDTEVVSDASTPTAFRAGVADPYFLNPSNYQGDYYFTGAVDHYPYDLALSLGDEVIATYPDGLFLEYEDMAWSSSFGYNGTQRVLDAIQYKNLKWIDISGADELSFNPKPFLLMMVNQMPDNLLDFQLAVGRQWTFGHDRAVEAIKVTAHGGVNVRAHLRRPINPKLKQEFSCKNAYEWETDDSDTCTNDYQEGCQRSTAKNCKPLR